MSAVAHLQLSGLTVGYNRVPVASALDIEVRAGEVVALLGANGAGKTTTMATIAGLLRPLGGALVIDGSDKPAPLHRRARAGLAYVPEHRAIIRKLTVLQNLRLGTKRVDDALVLFPELDAILHRRAGLLSGGEQQMLVLARAIANRPRLLLVDELSFGLAPLVVRRLLTAIRDAADQGAAVLLVEQHPAVAVACADRAYVLARGRIQLSAQADKLREHFDAIQQLYLTEGDG